LLLADVSIPKVFAWIPQQFFPSLVMNLNLFVQKRAFPWLSFFNNGIPQRELLELAIVSF